MSGRNLAIGSGVLTTDLDADGKSIVKLGGIQSIDGKGLSSNDYTDEEKAKLQGIENGAQKNPDLTPYAKNEDVNLKLTKKVDKVAGKDLSSNDYTTDEKNKLSGIESGAQVNPDLSPYAKTTEVNTLLANKVDKDGAKVLSTNDYTDADKTDLDNLKAKRFDIEVDGVAVEPIDKVVNVPTNYAVVEVSPDEQGVARVNANKINYISASAVNLTSTWTTESAPDVGLMWSDTLNGWVIDGELPNNLTESFREMVLLKTDYSGNAATESDTEGIFDVSLVLALSKVLVVKELYEFTHPDLLAEYVGFDVEVTFCGVTRDPDTGTYETTDEIVGEPQTYTLCTEKSVYEEATDPSEIWWESYPSSYTDEYGFEWYFYPEGTFDPSTFVVGETDLASTINETTLTHGYPPAELFNTLYFTRTYSQDLQTICLITPTASGVRDYLVDITIEENVSGITIEAESGGSFISVNAKALELEVGRNLLTFTEVGNGDYRVNREILKEVGV